MDDINVADLVFRITQCVALGVVIGTGPFLLFQLGRIAYALEAIERNQSKWLKDNR